MKFRREWNRKKHTPILVFADVIGSVNGILNVTKKKHSEFFKRYLSMVVGLEVNVEKNKWRLLFIETNRRTRFQIYSCTKLYMGLG